MKEAAAHHAHLTVVAVHEVPVSGWTGNPIILGADVPELEKTRRAAEEAVSKAAAQLGELPARVGDPARGEWLPRRGTPQCFPRR